MPYSFQAEDGRTYTSDEIFESVELSGGSQIKLKYHSNNPNISGVSDDGFYLPVNAISDETPQLRLCAVLDSLIWGR